jgi:hypothetical protein
MKRFGMVMLLLLALVGVVPAAAEAAPRTRCFDETGYCVNDPILSYWEKNGGLEVFGYPISGLRIETNNDGFTGPTQWFERDRLEDHGVQGVMAGRLGAQVVALPYRTTYGQEPVARAEEGCQYFAVTRHSVCEPFLSYWKNNGGLARFGYPLTEAIYETLRDPVYGSYHPYKVQFFERRRMEHHIAYAGTKYEVLLALLGTQLQQTAGCDPAAEPLTQLAAERSPEYGCPSWAFPPFSEGVKAAQRFQGGMMAWSKGGYRSRSHIYVIYRDKFGLWNWRMFVDGWYEGLPINGGETPPEGLYEPQRGFGKIWRENPAIREALGWAVAPEYAENGFEQWFDLGNRGMLLYLSETRVIYEFIGSASIDGVIGGIGTMRIHDLP